MKPSDLPSIYEYNDFREFLRDYQQARYARDKGYTKSAVCTRMGLPNSRSYFNDVLNGKKVTATYIDRFTTVLELDRDEARFFRVLVKFNQAEEPSERELYFGQLISLNRTPKRVMTPQLYRFYGEWYHSAVRAILDIEEFRGDYAALARKVVPPITVRQAKDSIKLLESLDLIRRNGNEAYRPTDKALATPDYARDELLRQYQIRCLELAKRAVMKKHGQPQDISTNTISISAAGYERLQKRLRQFRDEVRSLVNKDERPADRVYQLDIQLFPNSKIIDGKGNGSGSH